jgi:hypothetical protein
MEVAGIVLGAVPIILSALDSYKSAYSSAKKFSKWYDTIQGIRNNIFIQKRQLDATLKELGLQDPTMKDVRAALESNWPDHCERFMQIIQDMDDLMNKVMENLDVDAKGQVRLVLIRF